jgi:predicted nucleic acid-binding protein
MIVPGGFVAIIVLLVDTSVWVEIFRKPMRIDPGSLGDLEEVVTCLPIIQEVLQGFRDERAFRVAKEAMLALPCVESPLPLEVVEEAVHLYRSARSSGLTVRSGVDCLIAACAIRHGLTVLHHDRDFDSLAEISTLQARHVTTK